MPPSYRYEVASTGRAGCQVKECKEKSEKIAKGELRFGNLVTIQEHTSWKWKHWGCVTPLQISNVLEQIGGLEGLDLDKDLDILDGYDELPDWAQQKVKNALVNGHVDNEDWKGDPELNVPGARGLHKRTPKKKAKKDGDDDEGTDADASPVPTSKKGRTKKAAAKDEGDTEKEPKKRASKKRKADIIDQDGEEVEEESKPKPKRAAKKAKAAVQDEDSAGDDEPLGQPERANTGKKRGRRSRKETSTGIATAQHDGANDEQVERKPAAGRGRGSKKVKAESAAESEPEPEDEPIAKPRTKKTKAQAAKVTEAEADEVPAAPAKAKRGGRKVKEEPAVEPEEPVASKTSKGRGRPKTKAK